MPHEIARFRKKLADFRSLMRRYRSRLWLAGCSGGADSCALLLMLDDAAKHENAELRCVYFEHYLRGAEGEKDGDFVRELCRKNGIGFQKIDLAVSEKGHGLEAAAREARLAQWRRLAEETGGAVLLAHHAGDRRENLILRLMRGGNATSLTSLRKEASFNGMTILRPLLDFERSELEDFLRSRGVADWRNDPSNDDDRYDRNFLRNVFFRRFPAKRFDRSAEALALDADFLEKAAERETEKVAGKDETDAGFWLSLHPALLHRALHRYLSGKLGFDFLPDRAFCEKFRALASGRLQSLSLPGSDLFWCKREGKLRLEAAPAPEPRPAPALRGNWKDGVFDEVFAISQEPDYRVKKLPPRRAAFLLRDFPDELEYSPPLPGETMKIFPSGREEKLKKLRIDAKAPPRAPVLRDGVSGEVLWYPGVRHGVAALPENGETAVILSLKELDKDRE